MNRILYSAVVILCFALSGCGLRQSAHMAQADEFGYDLRIQDLIENMDRYDVYACRLVYNTAVVFDNKDDQYRIEPLQKWWNTIEDPQRLADIVQSMKQWFLATDYVRVVAVPGPGGEMQDAGFIYTPGNARIGLADNNPHVVQIQPVQIDEACYGVQSRGLLTDGPCYYDQGLTGDR